MSFLSSILLNLVKSDQVYVILGGSSASNNNTFFNYTPRENVYSYDFDKWCCGSSVEPPLLLYLGMHVIDELVLDHHDSVCRHDV